MARLPTKNDLSGPAPLRSGRIIARRDTTGVGQGVAALGDSLTDAAVGVYQKRRRENTIQDGTTADGVATRDLNDLEQLFGTDTEYDTIGTRFDQGVKEIANRASQYISNNDARSAWRTEFLRQSENARNRVIDRRDNNMREARLVNYKSGLEGYQQVIADPNADEQLREEAKRNAEDSIVAALNMGDLSPSEADKWRDAIITGGQFVYGQRLINEDPYAITGDLPPTVAERAGNLTTFYKSKGLPDVAVAGLLGNFIVESAGLDPTAVGDGGTAFGLAQWRGDRHEKLKKYAASRGSPWQDTQVQAEFSLIELEQDYPKYYRKLMAAETVEDAVQAVLGFERPKGYTDSDPTQSKHYGRRVKAAYQSMGENIPPDWYSNQSPANQLRLQNAAETRRNELDAATRGQIDIAVQNAPTAVLNTGRYDGYVPDASDFMRAYGPEEGSQRYNAFSSSLETSEQAYAMRTMPADKIAQLVSGAEPASSGENAALETQRYKTLVAAANATLSSRESDPAQYVTRTFPNVRSAWEQVSDPASYQRAISASVTAQQQLGIKNVAPLPKEQAQKAVAGFTDKESPEADRIAAVSSILMATQDPQQRRAIFDQMVGAGLPAISEGAFEAMSRGDEGAGRRLLQAAMVNPADLPGKISQTQSDIDEAIQSELMDDGEVGDIYYGLSDGTAANFERASRDSKLISNAVHLRLRQGESLSDAVSSVGRDLYGDVQAVETSRGVNARILVEKGTDTEAVLGGLRNMKPLVTGIIKDSLNIPEDAPVADGSRAIMEATSANYAERVVNEGYFRNAEGGYVFIDPFVGAALSDADGNPIVFTDTDVAESYGELEAKKEISRQELLEQRVQEYLKTPAERGIGMQPPAVMQNVIDAIDEESAPTLNGLPDGAVREREERAFREGRKAFDETQGTPAQKKKAQADTIERIMQGMD